MNQDLVKTFRKKLCSLDISDYYGLRSPGLTCYLNCILQVLFMTEDFREAVKRCRKEDSETFDSHLADLFADLEKKMAKTSKIIRKLGVANVYEQRDAAEYFEKILSQTNQEASKMFKGELTHTTKCLKCKETNDSRNFFWILPLVVEDLRHQIFSVGDGLEVFFKREKVCGENKIFCMKCQKKQDEEFGCMMTQSPEVLTLLLKRFSYDDVRRRYIKLHCKVEIPKTLHMANCTYDLYAVVDHFGELTGGHYTAQIKSFETQCWYNFNDESVTVKHAELKAEDKCLKSRTAYLLMYKKVRKLPEKCDDVDALCKNFDGEAEEKLSRAQSEEVPVLDHKLKDKSIPQQNFTHLNGEISSEIYGGVFLPKRTNFSERLENVFQQRAPQREEIQRHGGQKGPELNRRHLNVNTEALSAQLAPHYKNSLLENKHEKNCLRGKITDCDSAAKTVTRETDVSSKGNKVKPAEREAVKNKTEDDISQKLSATETVKKSEKMQRKVAKSGVKQAPWK